jgi:hypothetical protein
MTPARSRTRTHPCKPACVSSSCIHARAHVFWLSQGQAFGRPKPPFVVAPSTKSRGVTAEESFPPRRCERWNGLEPARSISCTHAQDLAGIVHPSHTAETLLRRAWARQVVAPRLLPEPGDTGLARVPKHHLVHMLALVLVHASGRCGQP